MIGLNRKQIADDATFFGTELACVLRGIQLRLSQPGRYVPEITDGILDLLLPSRRQLPERVG